MRFGAGDGATCWCQVRSTEEAIEGKHGRLHGKQFLKGLCGVKDGALDFRSASIWVSINVSPESLTNACTGWTPFVKDRGLKLLPRIMGVGVPKLEAPTLYV